jgi:tetratricopeptide (TPR) repeat protein
MSKSKLTTTGKSGGAKKPEQVAAVSKDAPTPRRVQIHMVQNVLLIWLDSHINENNEDCRNTISQLRRAVNNVNKFADSGECIEFINSISNEKACMIISGALGERIVPQVHDMPQVDSIFIFCNNKERHEQWAKDWPKIKGVFTDISPICEALKKAAQQCEHNFTPISFMATSGDASKKSLNQLDCSFMYTKIMKEILLAITFDNGHIKEFIQHCRDAFAGNNEQLLNVKQLEQNYHQKSPISWYTGESFLYPMLNHALRLMNADVIIKMGFYIGDLHRHIEQLHKEQYNKHDTIKIFTVYRGQGLIKTDFEQMSKTKGGLLSFNNFLSTSKNRDISLGYARRALLNPDMMGILFVMKIDPSQSTTPFASIKDESEYAQEDEILFSMHTIFRIHDIKRMGENQRLFQVDLTLTSDNDKDLRVLTERIREEIEGSTGWDRLGELLITIGQYKKAQEVYEVMLEQKVDDNSEKGFIYSQLGRTQFYQGEYKEAISFCEKALDIYKNTPPSNHSDLAKCHNILGVVYNNVGEYSKALSSHVKALEIRQQSLPLNHPSLAMSYSSIGNMYSNMGEYSKALSSHEKALEIRQQSLPPNHPDLAKSYNNIGNAYGGMGEYKKALSSYEKALDIQQQSLPSNHPDLAASYNNIGNVYYSMREFSKALSSYDKTLEIKQQSLPSNHPDLAKSYNNIGLIYENMVDYSKACSFFERAVEITQQSLPPNHPELQACKRNRDRVKLKLK